jgi:hypothetical protein
MASLVAVDHDPFAPVEDTGSGPLVVTVAPNRRTAPGLIPVDHDPFAATAIDPGGVKVAETEADVQRLEAQQPQVQLDAPSRGKSALLGAFQGATFNFGDEIASGVNAGLDYVTGQAPNGIGAAYDSRLADARRQMQEAETTNPGSFLAGQLGGGIATIPFTPMRAGVAGGLATGALYGGLSGAGAGEGVGGRLAGAGIGAGVGGALGAAAPVVIGGIGSAARGIGNAVSNATGVVRGALNPEAEAGRRVVGALARDARIGGSQMDDVGLAAAQAAGQPVRVADMGGETTRALARSAANTSPEGKAALGRLTNDRFETQGNRVVEFVQRLAGTKGDAGARREGLQAAAKAANRGAYARAYAEGASGIWDATLQRLAQAPALMKEIRDAVRRSANKAASQGFRPVQNPFVETEAGLAMKPGMTPSLQFWDVVKQGLDDQIEALGRAGAKSERADLIALRNSLRQHLDDLVPSYSAARRGAAAAFGAEDALEAGQKFISSSMSNHDARRALAKMSGPERALFGEGFAASLIEQVQRTGDRRNVINQIWGTARARERIEIALGKTKAAELEMFVRVENIMDMLRGAVSGNSTTVQQLAAMGLAGGATYSGFKGDASASNFAMGAAIGAILKRGSMHIDGAVAQRVAEMLASESPELVRKASAIVAKSKTLAEGIRQAEDRVTKALSSAANENVARPLSDAVYRLGSRAAASDPNGDGNP